MIVVDLLCPAEHRFEGWFASQEVFERQNAAQMVSCPVCGAHTIRRLPSAPHLARANTAEPAAPAPAAPNPQGILGQLIAALRDKAAQSEDVGPRFAEEARRIHYGDAEQRDIRGQAAPAEVRELQAEGISVLPVPPAKEDLH